MEQSGKASVFSKKMFQYAVKNPHQSSVRPFPFSFLNRLRPYLQYGVPLNILIAINEMCWGKCYDMALLVTLAFDKCNYVNAKHINSLIHPNGDKKGAGHAFVESDRQVFDTTAGLVFSKSFYYEIERPKIEHKQKIVKEESLEQYPTLSNIIATDTESEKYAFMSIEPTITGLLQHTNEPATKYYKPYIMDELRTYMEGINYNEFIKDEQKKMFSIKHIPAFLNINSTGEQTIENAKKRLSIIKMNPTAHSFEIDSIKNR